MLHNTHAEKREDTKSECIVQKHLVIIAVIFFHTSLQSQILFPSLDNMAKHWLGCDPCLPKPLPGYAGYTNTALVSVQIHHTT